MRAEREGGTAARLVGTVGAPSVRDTDCPHGRSHGPVRVSVEPLVAGDQKGQSFCIALPFQALRGLPCLGSFSVAQHIRHMARRPWLGPYSVDWRIRHLKRHPGWVLLWSSVYQEFDGTASPLFSCQRWCVGAERLWWRLNPLCVTQQYLLASMAAWLSSTGISHHSLLLHIPEIISPQSTAALALGLRHNP